MSDSENNVNNRRICREGWKHACRGMWSQLLLKNQKLWKKRLLSKAKDDQSEEVVEEKDSKPEQKEDAKLQLRLRLNKSLKNQSCLQRNAKKSLQLLWQ